MKNKLTINEKNNRFINIVKNKLIVSCQALEDEPLHGSEIMAKMALAAKKGGAVAIRANSGIDIKAIKKEVDLPIIGLVKKDYDDSEVYITPTKKEIDELIDAGVDVIALDATFRRRPNNVSLEELIDYIHTHNILVLADISNLEEGINACKYGADMISTTLSGYTPYTEAQNDSPDFELVKELLKETDKPIFAEGRIQTPEEAVKMFEYGAHSVVVGSAITRPRLITEKFTKKVKIKVEKS